MQSVIKERHQKGPFLSLEDFCSRLDSRSVNRKILESLVKAGAFDFDVRNRSELFRAIEPAIAAAVTIQKDREAGQVSLFDDLSVLAPVKKESRDHHHSTNIPTWTIGEQLAYEKELLGFYVTGHPLDDYRGTLETGNFKLLKDLFSATEPRREKAAGLITSFEKPLFL
jgi:DNA polymerase-3 subunit alpha